MIIIFANYSTTAQINTNYYDKLNVDSISGNLYNNYYIKSEVNSSI